MSKTLQRALARAMCATVAWAALLAGLPGQAQAGFGTPPVDSCDPSKASCTGSGDCPQWKQDLGMCKPPPGSGDGPGMCTPPPNGNPSCGSSGPSNVGSANAQVSVGAGNPINLVTGNKYQEETDLAALPGVLGLELKRYYNSRSSHPGLLGASWRMSYEAVLVDLGGQIQIVQADGRRLSFQRGVGGNATLCTSPSLRDGQVRIEEPQSGKGQRVYHWRWPDGRTLMFSGGSGGGYPLQSITAATGESVTLTYSPQGELVQVRDPQGRKLSLIYAKRTLQAIDTPLGRLSYRQDKQGRLAEVASSKDAKSAPDQTRVYHYEEKYNAGHPNALTGISVKGIDPATGKTVEQRLSTYAYNAAGQAIMSTKGRPKELDKDGKPLPDTGIEQVQVQYLDRPVAYSPPDKANGEAAPKQVDKTILTNSLGQTTEVLSAVIGGQPRLIEMRGPGCSTCGPSNMRYAYDASGRLVKATKLDDQGQPTLSEITQHDRYGRIARIGQQRYPQGTKGKAEPIGWIRRYEYADVKYKDGSVAVAPQPSVIAQPSVVAGREHVTRIAYNELWQPTAITEEGFSPIDDKGQPSAQGAPISRTTTYKYTAIHGRTLLAEIDGPLPNGPKSSPMDSDVTRIAWDASGQSIKDIIYPANLQAHVEQDGLGRLKAVTGPSGLTDRYRYDERGELVAIEHRSGSTLIDGVAYRHDLLGRVTETLRIAGDKDLPKTRQSFDIGGRLQWQADALGILRQARYDSEDHLLSSQVLGAGIEQQEHYAYDPQGRLQRVEDSTGAQRDLVRDDTGRLVATIDPLGRWTRYQPEPHGLNVIQAANTSKPLSMRYELDEHGHLQAVSADASDGLHAVRSTKYRRVIDDFGREVATLSPDSGREVRRFDTASRIVQVLQADGAIIDLEYDLADHLVRRTVTPHAASGAQAGGIPTEAAKPQTVRYVYESTRLIQISDPEQDERYAYDELARVASKTVTLRLNNGSLVTSPTRYRYDDQGLLAAQSLPDGSELQYERNGQRQIVALHRQTSPWAPFGWGRTVLVKDLQRDLVGLRHLTYGNGVQGQWQRSREGMLARVVYTSPHQDPSALRTAFESLMSEARAQAAPPATAASAPGAFGLSRDDKALWDSRLLFDAAGNIVVQGQYADSAAARPGHTLLAYDAQDQLAQAVQTQAATATTPVSDRPAPPPTTWRYHHDSLGNRLLAQQGQPPSDTASTMKAAYAPEGNRLGDQPMDEAGRPAQDGQRGYRWDGLGRLTSVTKDGKTTAYRYNRLGLRIAKQGDIQQHYLYDEQRHRLAELDAQGKITREYVWLGDQLIAVIDPEQPAMLNVSAESFFERIGRSLQVMWSGIAGKAVAIAYVHVNHLGAPVAMTDEHGKPIWAAEYAPFGKRIAEPVAAGIVKTAAPGHAPQAGVRGIRLDLRLPGQWADEESGLHYNDQRYYDPQQGRYISPDPLGLMGGLNAYAYVGNNPLGYSDPLGLILFAFDGTDNTNDLNWLHQNDSSLSNVWQFRELYNDGNRRYITGVGTVHHDPIYGDINPPLKDDAFNRTGVARIDRMIKYFDEEAEGLADDTQAMDVDIVGFSRGAAEARDFANQIAAHTLNGVYHYSVTNKDGTKTEKCQTLNFRFMGLWDTVLSTNSGRNYNLAIPDQFAYVAHATALNEYRSDTKHPYHSWGAFPLESIMPGTFIPPPVSGKTRIERGFLGAHADIGGGFEEEGKQLAQVALAWMVKQAEAAGVKMGDSPELHAIIASPVVHDKSDSILTGAPTVKAEDREIRFRDGTKSKMRTTTFPDGMSYADTQQFIQYLPVNDPRRHQFVTGTVDMKGYLGWLNAHGYGLDDMTVH